MALIKFSSIVDKISGKLGGSIFGTSISGSYVKQNSFSQQPNTPMQSIQRTKIGLVPQLWRSLASSQRVDWENATADYPYVNRLEQIVFYTGYGLFLFLNQNLAVIGIPPNLSVPVFQPINDITIGVFGGTTLYTVFSLTDWLSGYDAVVYATEVFNSPQSVPENKLKFFAIETKPATNVLFQINHADLVNGASAVSGSYFYIAVKTVSVSNGNTSIITKKYLRIIP